MDNPYAWLQEFVAQVPEILRPLVVALAGAVPYVEGEGAAAFGILAGLHPVVAAAAGATGNIACVLAVVLLGSRLRDRVVSRRAAGARTSRAGSSVVAAPPSSSADGAGSAAVSRTPGPPAVGVLEQPAGDEDRTGAKPTRRAKGRARLNRWVVRFGVPGASLLAPLALPTMLTAAFFVGSGVPKHWVLLWQVVAIVSWTSAVAVAATGALALLGW
ncbi:hypothetical protein ACFFOM_05190 [Microlunatus capsulatus]|uniref:Small multidrug efflux protein n=1 Tax=Microlunatus capsulatus TaxID=99117 RepID=A0ABS4Z4Y9_9ACTN|nr:hypothetical protein [Microlunatus capsulatus]MBP2416111.1 hypothetical protein [Microlunatus capsulatus]